MSLGTDTLGSSGATGNSKELAHGVYADEVTIDSIKDISGKPISFIPDESRNKFDCAIEVTVNKEGIDFQPTYTLFGNFKKDDAGNITDWGGAFVIGEFFKALGIEGTLSNDHKIPQNWRKDALGRKIVAVSYAAGYQKKNTDKVAYSNWNRFGSVQEQDFEAACNHLAGLWAANRAKGYPSNYDPSVIKKGASAQSASATAAPGAGSTVDDDDLPF